MKTESLQALKEKTTKVLLHEYTYAAHFFEIAVVT